MPIDSIFLRSRSTSTSRKESPTKALVVPVYDEFGRVDSRAPPHKLSKKDSTRDRKRSQSRVRTPSSSKPDHDVADLAAQLPDGSFLPLNLDRPHDESGEEKTLEHDYGYLSYERHVILGLDDVARLVDVIAVELGARGLTTPFIFSTLALDISSSAIKRLIHGFLDTCASPDSRKAEQRWRDEVRFAGPHELGMCIRWGLARVVRVVGGKPIRGLVSWDHYVEFRDLEAALNYPPTHFTTFLSPLPPVLRTILLTLLSLLIRFTAHSASSGYTPPALSPLFGPLFFGLGPPCLSFHHTYVHYLRAVNAMEHIMLAFIRWQDAPKVSGARSDVNAKIAFGSALGVPARLKDWIRAYPTTLRALRVNKTEDGRLQARRGARTMCVVNVRRNVPTYSPDLVKTAASWASPSPSSQGGAGGLAGSKEWERVAATAFMLQPRYSDGYRKRMNLPPNFYPYTGLGSATSSATGTSSATVTLGDGKGNVGPGGIREDEDRFRTLTQLKWGEFETAGFGGLETDEKKLQFNITESEHMSYSANRTTMNWNDFSAVGFNRSDVRLSSLQLTPPMVYSVSAPPSRSSSITKKLRKTRRALPPFTWDTEPVMGSEEVIEEAFMDVFCDLVYGGGWMDVERREETDRDCNWALIEFKSLPLNERMPHGSDPRTATTIFVFEEFVPLEYRQQLAKESGFMRRLPFLFSPSGKSKPWKSATSLNRWPSITGSSPKGSTVYNSAVNALRHGSWGTLK